MERAWSLLIILLTLTATSIWASRRSHKLRQFNTGSDVSFAASSSGKQANVAIGKACNQPASNILKNANIHCTPSSCRVKCNRGYLMDGSRTLYLSCNSETGIYVYQDQPWQLSLPACLPQCRGGCPDGSSCVAPNQCEESEPECPPGFTGPNCEDFDCDPPCQNGGTCIFVDVCNCPQGYSGHSCAEHICTLAGLEPANAAIGSDNDLAMMEVKCNAGYNMKSGLNSQTFLCKHHAWITQDGNIPIDEVDVNCYE